MGVPLFKILCHDLKFDEKYNSMRIRIIKEEIKKS